MRKINLRDANQQFSRLVREVEETGETVQILRRGEPAAELRPVAHHPRRLTAAQEAALKSMLETARKFGRKSVGRKLTRDEMHER
jgi:prevent-host-death family protein